MDIRIRRTCRFNEVSVSEGNATITTGLLDDKESGEIARELLDAAMSLDSELIDDLMVVGASRYAVVMLREIKLRGHDLADFGLDDSSLPDPEEVALDPRNDPAQRP